MNLEEFKNTLTSGNYDDIKPFLRMEVRNKANLSPNAYYKTIIGDIVTVPVFQTMLDDNSVVSAIVTNTLVNSLGDSIQQLLDDARKNTPPLFKYNRLSDICKNIRKHGEVVLENYTIDSIDALVTSNDILNSIIVVSIDGTTRVSVLQFPEILSLIQTNIGDYYIIPSSVYEQMIIPADKVDDIVAVKDIIHHVNSTVVEPSDVLSDKLLRYDNSGLSEC